MDESKRNSNKKNEKFLLLSDKKDKAKISTKRNKMMKILIESIKARKEET